QASQDNRWDCSKFQPIALRVRVGLPLDDRRGQINDREVRQRANECFPHAGRLAVADAPDAQSKQEFARRPSPQSLQNREAHDPEAVPDQEQCLPPLWFALWPAPKREQGEEPVVGADQQEQEGVEQMGGEPPAWRAGESLL